MQTVILMLNNLVDDYYTNVFQYDSFGRLANITQTGTDLTTKAVDYVYNLNGQRTGATYKQNGDVVSESSWAYDAANRTTSIQHKKANDDIFAEYGLTWDAANRITEFETVDGAAEYTYDATGQLTGADYDYITDEVYSYDDNGNRVTANGDTYATGDNNETTFDGTYRYSYDAEGNRTEKYLWTDTDEDGIIDESEKTLVQTCSWDYRNRLESVTNYDSSGIATETIEYIYDYLNQMIARSVISASTFAVESSESFVYSNGQIVLEYDTTSAIDAVTAINLWGANVDELIAVERLAQSVNANNEIYWAYGDHLNSIRDVVSYNPTTDTTTVINHLIYDAFGNLASSVDPSQSTSPSISPLLLFRYTGKYFDDATGLQNNLNRWLDSTTGKWISVDPIGFNGGGSNLYRYCKNKTSFLVDYLGLEETQSFYLNKLYETPIKQFLCPCQEIKLPTGGKLQGGYDGGWNGSFNQPTPGNGYFHGGYDGSWNGSFYQPTPGNGYFQGGYNGGWNGSVFYPFSIGGIEGGYRKGSPYIVIFFNRTDFGSLYLKYLDNQFKTGGCINIEDFFKTNFEFKNLNDFRLELQLYYRW